MIEKVIINTEKSRKTLSKKLKTMLRFYINNFVAFRVPNKRIRSLKRKKPLKGIKWERKEIHSIKGTIIEMDFIIALVEDKEFRVPSKILKKNEMMKVTYECIVEVK